MSAFSHESSSVSDGSPISVDRNGMRPFGNGGFYGGIDDSDVEGRSQSARKASNRRCVIGVVAAIVGTVSAGIAGVVIVQNLKLASPGKTSLLPPNEERVVAPTQSITPVNIVAEVGEVAGVVSVKNAASPGKTSLLPPNEERVVVPIQSITPVNNNIAAEDEAGEGRTLSPPAADDPAEKGDNSTKPNEVPNSAEECQVDSSGNLDGGAKEVVPVKGLQPQGTLPEETALEVVDAVKQPRPGLARRALAKVVAVPELGGRALISAFSGAFDLGKWTTIEASRAFASCVVPLIFAYLSVLQERMAEDPILQGGARSADAWFEAEGKAHAKTRQQIDASFLPLATAFYGVAATKAVGGFAWKQITQRLKKNVVPEGDLTSGEAAQKQGFVSRIFQKIRAKSLSRLTGLFLHGALPAGLAQGMLWALTSQAFVDAERWEQFFPGSTLADLEVFMGPQQFAVQAASGVVVSAYIARVFKPRFLGILNKIAKLTGRVTSWVKRHPKTVFLAAVYLAYLSVGYVLEGQKSAIGEYCKLMRINDSVDKAAIIKEQWRNINTYCHPDKNGGVSPEACGENYDAASLTEAKNALLGLVKSGATNVCSFDANYVENALDKILKLNLDSES